MGGRFAIRTMFDVSDEIHSELLLAGIDSRRWRLYRKRFANHYHYVDPRPRKHSTCRGCFALASFPIKSLLRALCKEVSRLRLHVSSMGLFRGAGFAFSGKCDGWAEPTFAVILQPIAISSGNMSPKICRMCVLTIPQRRMLLGLRFLGAYSLKKFPIRFLFLQESLQ